MTTPREEGARMRMASWLQNNVASRWGFFLVLALVPLRPVVLKESRSTGAPKSKICKPTTKFRFLMQDYLPSQ